MIEKLNETAGSCIYVLLTDTGTLFTRTIKWFTGAPYNHVSLSLDAQLNELYSFGRLRAKNPWIAGFIKEDVYEGTFRHFPNTACLLLRLPVTNEQRSNAIQVTQSFLQRKKAYRYNLLGLFGVLFNVHIKNHNAYFCSQFVSEALSQSGLSLWNRPSALVTPNDFLHHEQFEKVYEGLLYQYPLLDIDKLSSMRTAGKRPMPLQRQSVYEMQQIK